MATKAVATEPAAIKPGDKAWWHRHDGSRFAVAIQKVFKTTCWGIVVTDGERVNFDTTKGIPLAEIFPAGEPVTSELSYVTVDPPENPEALHKTSGPSDLDHPELSYKTNAAGIPNLSYKTDSDRSIDDSGDAPVTSNLSYVTVDPPENPEALHKTSGPSDLDHPELSYKTNAAGIPNLSYKTDSDRIIDDCRKLGRSDLVTLRNLIDELLVEGEEFSVPVNPRREVVKREVIGSVVYQLEKISCGKERCRRCPHGHGPYWYSYQRRDGKVVSKYIGKTLDL